MKLAAGSVEAKVAASTGSTAVVAAVFGLAAFYHWFTPPPPYLTALLASLVAGAAGYFAPHTARSSGDPVTVAISSPGTTPAQVIAAIRDTVHKVDPLPIGRGGYRGGMPASEMRPPPRDVPSGAVPQAKPPAAGTGTTT